MNPAACAAPAALPPRSRIGPAAAPVEPPPVRAPSCLYECRMLHHRFAPREHRFSYRLFYLCVDLDEPVPAGGLRLLAFNARGIFSLHDRDFLPIHEPLHGPSALPLREWCRSGDLRVAGLKARVLAFCGAHGVALGDDARVQLITLPRLLGYQFNPVSFYFCFERDGTPRAAIAEVTNTFREIKPYFLPLAAPAQTPPTFCLRLPKHFYVSPFSSVDVEFDFVLQAPGRRLAVQIDDYEAGVRVLHATLTGERVELSDRRLAWFLLKYPFLTLGVMARIHWQAARLWLKRLPVFGKATAAGRQRDLYRPHSSLSDRPST